MMDGRVVQTGAPSEVYRHPASRIVAEFVGEANFLPGEVAGGLARCELGQFPVRADFTGTADVMIRAEEMALSSDGDPDSEVVGIEYYGHDQMATVRAPSGRLLKVRLAAGRGARPGERVHLAVPGEVLAFPSE
jgi:iron(III) transport system ATP-binding protein